MIHENYIAIPDRLFSATGRYVVDEFHNQMVPIMKILKKVGYIALAILGISLGFIPAKKVENNSESSLTE